MKNIKRHKKRNHDIKKKETKKRYPNTHYDYTVRRGVLSAFNYFSFLVRPPMVVYGLWGCRLAGRSERRNGL